MSADKQTSVTTDKQADNLPDKETPPVRRRSPPKANANPQTSSLISQRRAEAKALAESLTTTVTLRLPRDLNDWLDEYVHRAWPERVRKQELVIEALRMLFVRRGRPGEEILETDLLPRKEEE